MEIEMKSTLYKHLITDFLSKRENARKCAFKRMSESKLHQLNQLLIKQKNDDR